jgi:ABC-type transporter Mla subunit MlaD
VGRRSTGIRGWLRRRDEVPAAELLRARRPLRTGVLVLVVVAIAVYVGFTKSVPFSHGYRLNAVFTTVVDVAPGSPVRVAGVPVGKVTSIARHGNVGEMTMEISSSGLPIHEDATVKIRPRLFLEGNWFVELQQGSPSAPTVSSGYTIPITQASDPVQLDQVLDALNSSTRSNLQEVLVELGRAYSQPPTAAEDSEAEGSERGLTGAEAINKAARLAPKALRGAAIVNQALGGTHEKDLSTLVASVKRVAGALDVHSAQLGELIVNFNTFLGEFASRSVDLNATVARLPGALHSASRAFAGLHAALAPLRSFSDAIIPGVRQTPATVIALKPWIAQLRGSLGPAELGGVAADLRASAPAVAQLTTGTNTLFEQNSLLSQCLTDVLIPAGNTKLQDGANTSGQSVFREFWYSLVGSGSVAQNFTGNGLDGFRSLIGGGGSLVRSAPVTIPGVHSSAGDVLVARTPLAPLGVSPRFPASEPPYRPLEPCYKQSLPDFNGSLASGPADGSSG